MVTSKGQTEQFCFVRPVKARSSESVFYKVDATTVKALPLVTAN